MQTREEIDVKRKLLNPSRPKSTRTWVCAVVLGLSAMHAGAAAISGKVINKTTGRPAVGDEVILMDVSADMIQAGRARTDGFGDFHFRVAREGIPWLITVTHAGVRYEAAVPAESSPAEIEVFDKAASTADIKSGIQVIQIENDGADLRMTEMFTLSNGSRPPRTIQNEELFSIPLPPGAVLLSSLAEAPGESVIKSVAVAAPKDNRCYFNFPLRPGTTKIQLQYRLPYTGPVTFAPYIPFPADMFGVVTAPSMQFRPAELGAYTRQPSGDGGIVELIRNAHTGNAPSFTISGSGTTLGESGSTGFMPRYGTKIQEEPVAAATAGTESTNTTKNLVRDQLLWPMLLVSGLIACSTVFYVRRVKQRAATVSGTASITDEIIRERLFSLELDRLQNRISKSKYAAARSVLEKKLAKTLARTRTP